MMPVADERIANLELDSRLNAQRFRTIETGLESVLDHVARVSEKLDSVTRLQEADIRHNENILRALTEVAELRKEAKDAVGAYYVRWEHWRREQDTRWERLDSDRTAVKEVTQGHIHRIDRKVAWFMGLLTAAQLALIGAGSVYLRSMNAIEADNARQWQFLFTAAEDRRKLGDHIAKNEQWINDHDGAKNETAR